MKTHHPSRFCRYSLLFAVIVVQILFGAAAAQAATGKGSSSSLALGISVSPASGPLGSFLDFSITLTNLSPVAASNIVVQDVLPAGLAVTASSTMSGSYSSGDWSVPLLAGDTTASLILTTRIIGSGTMTNTVLLLASAPQNTNFAGNSASVSITGTPVTGLAVQVIQCDSQGRVVGPLAGASVSVVGSVSGTTDAAGQWSTTNIAAGNYTVTVTNSGFYPVTQSVTIAQDQMPSLSFVLATNAGPGAPVMFNFIVSAGKYLVPAMPGTLTFSAIVAWNGTPGTASFIVNGTSMPATINDLGNGTALATLTVAAPGAISAANELIGTAVNGQNLSGSFNAGAFFEPLPGMITSWYTWLGNSLTWANLAAAVPKINYSYAASYRVFNYSLPNQSLDLNCNLGMNLGVMFTPLDGTFKGSLGGTGKANLDVSIPGASGVEVSVEGNLGLTGTLQGAFAGLNPPTFTPSWRVTANVTDGVKMPAVSFVPAVLPAAAPAITFLQNTWGIKSIINSIKLGATLTEGGSLTGVYQNGALGSCFLKTTKLNGSLNAGLKLEASAKLGPAKAKIYGGGNGTVTFDLCPEFNFTSLTLEAYAGVSASALVFSYDKKFSAMLTFGSVPNALPLDDISAPTDQNVGSSWQPIGASLSNWGAPDQLRQQTTQPTGNFASDASPSSSSSESLLVSNVLDNTSPSVYADSGQTEVLFTLLNTNQPWYASTAIGMLRQTNGGAWTLSQVTDDDVPDCNPQVAAVNSNLLFAAWERIVGDISQATNPAQVAGDLEIVAAWFDPQTGAWTNPVQLTTNSVTDRDPLPVVFGSTQGILWVENQAGDLYGDATNGDSLMFSRWTGAGWTAPESLWFDNNGILSFSFVSDAAGQGHVVFAVDQDGQWDTTTDRVLYATATVGGVWQSPIQLTDDSLGDDTPTLVAPNGNPMCVWNQGGTLVYSPLSSWNPQMVYAQTNAANDAPNFAGVTLPGGAAIAYAGQTPDGVNLYAAFYNAAQNIWTLPRQLTSNSNEESSAVALAFDGTNIVAAFANTQLIYTNVTTDDDSPVTLTNAPQPGRTDLYVLTHTPGVDPGVSDGSLNLNPTNPAPGSSATVSAVIENFGDVPLTDIPVAFYDGDPNSGGIMIGSMQSVSSLEGGATQQVSVVWNVPPGNASHQVYVVVDPDDTLPDRDRSNNTNSVLTVLPDMVVDSTANTEEGVNSVSLNSEILNQGVIASGPFTVSWLLGSTNGPQIASCQVGSLAPGQSVPAIATWNTAGQAFTTPYVPVYTVVDSSNAVVEMDKSNNIYLQMVSVVPSWVPQITGISVTNNSSVQIQFNAANSTPSDFVIQGSGSLVSPVSWQAESGATITTISPGVFQAVVPAQGNMMFYRVQTTSP